MSEKLTIEEEMFEEAIFIELRDLVSKIMIEEGITLEEALKRINAVYLNGKEVNVSQYYQEILKE